MRKKEPEDQVIGQRFFGALLRTNADFTNSFRLLSQVGQESGEQAALFPEGVFEQLKQQSGSVQDAVRAIDPPFNRAQLESLKVLQRENPQTFLMITGGQEGVIERGEAALAQVEKLRALSNEDKKALDGEVWREWLELYSVSILSIFFSSSSEFCVNYLSK